MQAAITQRLLQSIKPAEKPFEVCDSKLTGFILRVQPSGKRSYIVQWARGKRATIGDAELLTPEQARRKAAAVLGAAAEGDDPRAVLAESKSTLTLGEYLEGKYKTWLEANRKSGKATAARLRSCFASSLGHHPLGSITAWQIEKWRSARLKAGTSAATVNRDIGALKAALNRAVEWGLIESHPLGTVKPQKLDSNGRVRYLTPDEERALRGALDAREDRLRKDRDSGNAWRERRGYDLKPARGGTFADYLRPIVLTAINTGLRRGELLGLRWSDVDLSRRTLTVRGSTAKSSQTRHIPLNAEAHRTLEAWKAQQENAEGFVFPGRDGAAMTHFKRSWDGVLAAAGLAFGPEHPLYFRFHDIRHHFASRLVMAGVDLNTVRDLLGHGDIKMTLRYAHLAPEHRAAAVERLMPPERVRDVGIG